MGIFFFLINHLPNSSSGRLTQLVFVARGRAVVLTRQQLQLGSTLSQLSLLKVTQCLDVVEVRPQGDAGRAAEILLQGADAGLPLLHRGPVAERHVALARLVDQEVDHLWRTLCRLEEHRLPVLSFFRTTGKNTGETNNMLSNSLSLS